MEICEVSEQTGCIAQFGLALACAAVQGCVEGEFEGDAVDVFCGSQLASLETCAGGFGGDGVVQPVPTDNPNNTPSSTPAAGGCGGACQSVATQCGGGTAADLSQCDAACASTSAAGCGSQYGTLLQCIANNGCGADGTIDFADPNSPCYSAIMGLIACDPNALSTL